MPYKIQSITAEDYFMGRDKTHEHELTDELKAHAAETVKRVNLLLERANMAEAFATIDLVTHTVVGSGWRPLGVNATTSNSAKNSPHITCEACDIRDTGKRELARWACTPEGRKALEEIGLWCERPQWTPFWLHVQTRPPKSGHRFFIPSSAPPLTSILPNEGS